MFGGQRLAGISGTCIISGGRVGMTVDVDNLVAIATGGGMEPDEGPEDASSYAAMRDVSLFGPEGGLETGGSLPGTVAMKHSQEELISKAKLTAKRDNIANRMEESGQKDLSDADVSDLLDELARGLVELQDALLSLENEADNVELMKESFRRLHAAKGNFTMLGADNSAALSHGLETLLDYIRKGRIAMSQELMDLLLDGVAELDRATKTLPKTVPPPSTQILTRIDVIIRSLGDNAVVTDPDKLLGTTFSLVPIVELQLLGALKQGAKAYESFLRFKPSHQAEYLVAYLMLRKLCYYGTILATLPSIGDIEQGHCGCAVKILWATSMGEGELKAAFDELAPLYNIVEHQSIPTTVFRYDLNADA
ncbi:MAG TPA: hypothetical protein DEB39_00955 [Planctomycetaceae bacterium]|nr:hypothetical protein [Planctomycetaceae bacterium]